MEEKKLQQDRELSINLMGILSKALRPADEAEPCRKVLAPVLRL